MHRGSQSSSSAELSDDCASGAPPRKMRAILLSAAGEAGAATARSGEVCTDASLSHEPASENNTRWGLGALEP